MHHSQCAWIAFSPNRIMIPTGTRTHRYSHNDRLVLTKRRYLRCMQAVVAISVLRSSSSCTDSVHAFCESFPHHGSFSKILHYSNIQPSRLTYKHPSYDSTKKITTVFYAPNDHTTRTGPMVAQAFYSSQKTNRNPTKPRNCSKPDIPLSKSILSSSDTLPAFPTAHGLLSPETVLRMEVTTHRGRDRAVDFFLDTYRRNGPMACLPLLSDQNVLPHLTKVMREMID